MSYMFLEYKKNLNQIVVFMGNNQKPIIKYKGNITTHPHFLKSRNHKLNELIQQS